ncbi:MAG: hypothetical protein JJ902_20395 [Roseibium sp.]|nr:hypothetical protein [Roseibium sp.]
MARLYITVTHWVIGAFYAYGALVHILNMAGMAGFDWPDAPLKWQVLDVVYLLLDIVVVAGLLRGVAAGYAAFFVAAVSQILLYTLGRDWIVDVPEAFARTPDERAYLNTLVAFHIVTMCALGLALWLKWKRSSKAA